MMNKPIPYGKQHITKEDIDAVIDTLQSDYLTQGPEIKKFEDAFAQYIDCDYAVAVANGTAALHLGALALNVQKGQTVITTPITFAASSNCIEYCGGSIEFCDINPKTYLIDIEKLEEKISKNPDKYVGIIPVDFGGNAVNLEEINRIAHQYNLWIMEDACHAPGGYFTDLNNTIQTCGNGVYADLSIFSFHPVKHIACGEGGMITTNNKNLYEKLLQLRTHGITRNETLFSNEKYVANGFIDADSYPGWYMEMQTLGYNYRLTDFQAALGFSQLQRADIGLERRREIAKKYATHFNNCNYILGHSNYIEGHAYHLYIIEVNNRLELYNYLRTKNIFAQVHYIPTHIMPYYKNKGWKLGDFPIAEKYYSQCLSIPMYHSLTEEEQNYVIQSIDDFYAK